MKYFISDTHIGHANILKFDNRPFASITEHDETLVQNVNDTLKGGDDLYHLGDVAWSQKDFDFWVSNLRSDIIVHYVRGNHDHRIQRSHHWKDVMFLKNTAVPFWLSHYPHLSWPNSFHGSIHLFGHVHGNTKGVGRSLDVSANMIDYKPISEEEVFEKLVSLPALNV